MGSRTIGCWLLTIVMIAPADRILGTDSPKVPTNVAYVSEEEGGIREIDLSTLRVIRRVQPSDIAPRGLAVTFDGKYVITSHKNTRDGVVFSAPDLSLLTRIHIGESPEFIKINPAGDRVGSFLVAAASVNVSSLSNPSRPSA